MSNSMNSEKTDFLKMGAIDGIDDDQLNMKGSALAIAQLIVEVEPPFTIGLRGDWGSGKSSMIRMVQSLFDQNEQLASTNNQESIQAEPCLLYTSPSPRDKRQSRMPSSA